MATTPRIPPELVEGFFMQVEDDGSPASAIAIPVELSRLAGIPIRTRKSFQIEPVLHELDRAACCGAGRCERPETKHGVTLLS